jgi:hypothetical protein
MHEIGHALSVGWADDKPIPTLPDQIGPKAFEVYSGIETDDAGGIDESPEPIESGEQEWSIMMSGRATRFDGGQSPHPILVLSLEEIATIDLEDVPSKSESD